MLMQEFILAVEKKVRDIFKVSSAAHDLEHTLRVLSLAESIGGAENANIYVIRAASLLHDIGRKEQDESKGKLCHAEIGAEKARKILVEIGADKSFVEEVCHCVKTHRFRGKNTPESIEAKILFDADKLDSIGAVGIGRAFLFAGEVGAKLHNHTIDIALTKSYTEEDTAYREFMVKLRYVKDRMLTEKARIMAIQRHEFMEAFFKRLTEECEGLL